MVMKTPKAKPRKLLTDTMIVATNPKCLNTNLFAHSQLLTVAFDEVTDPKPASDTLMKSGKSSTRFFRVVVEVTDVEAGVELLPLVVVEAVGGAGVEGTNIYSPQPPPTPGLTRVFIYSERKL